MGSALRLVFQYFCTALRRQLRTADMQKRTFVWLGLCVLGFASWGIASTVVIHEEDGLPTLQSLEARPSMQPPQLSLPHDLTVVPAVRPGEYHVPGRVEDLADTHYSGLVDYGRNIFVNTQIHAKRYVGNGLNCANCHLQEGRKPYAAPLWAAYPLYPMYRDKSRQVVTFQERLQDCFRFSLNGIAPTLDSLEIKALTAYAHFLATDIPLGTIMPGRGFNRIDKSADPSSINGRIVYDRHCVQCHGADMLGKKFTNRPGYMFPPLAGPDSYNKGAGMYKVKTCASFVQANMPLGKPNTLTDDEALEVCVHLHLADRPWDPRKSWFISLFSPASEGG